MVRVVVVNYEGGDITLRCLDALLRTDHPTDDLDLVVVDNNSHDGVVDAIRARYPRVRVIESPVNVGFGRGCNLALSDLRGVHHVALVNNDAVVEPGWLTPLLDAIEPEHVGAACPKLLLDVHVRAVVMEAPPDAPLEPGRGVGVTRLMVDGVDRLSDARFDERFWAPQEVPAEHRDVRWTRRPQASVWWPVEAAAPAQVVELGLHAPAPVLVSDGAAPQHAVTMGDDVGLALSAAHDLRVVNSAGGVLYSGWFGGDRGYLEVDLGQYDEPAEVFSWCGGAVLLKAEYLRDVGLFDPTFFLYYEDFDLSWRGRARGWRYVYEPRSVVFHAHGWSSGIGSEAFNDWVDRNRRLTLVKNGPWATATRACLGAVSTAVRDIAAHVVGALRTRKAPSPSWVVRRTRRSARVLRAVPHALRERWRINRGRTVPRSSALEWMRPR